jgi:hypothetical protein
MAHGLKAAGPPEHALVPEAADRDGVHLLATFDAPRGRPAQ